MGLLGNIWAKTIGKVADGAGSISKDITKVKLAKSGDKTQIEGNAHGEYMEMLKFRGGNSFNAVNRNKFDSLVDGLNRLVFPLTAFPFIYLLWKLVIETPQTLLDSLGATGLLTIIGTLLGVRQIGKKIALNKKIETFVLPEKKEEKPVATEQKKESKSDTLTKIEYADTCTGILSNQKTVDMVLQLGEKLGADKILVTGADRSEKIHQELIDKKITSTPYEKTQHSSIQGYKAADVKYYNKFGVQILPLLVAKAAITFKTIGGIGVYKDFTHLDHRERKADGSIYSWGDWS